ncbi:M48 family metallopeptidase [Chitinolyticbacter albus]|uniref:M48 family metallopeptidase n=1 Tax=Chitinolyticbacter albus TaxID=2961951 RepID=UPI00210D8657|nr:M48 family metallopeptidase [Chitinolyticbacter albus]
MSKHRYLAAYPPHLVERVTTLLDEGRLGAWLQQRYPNANPVQSDAALYDYVLSRKQRFLRNTPPPSKVLYDNQLDLVGGTLGSSTFASRVQGGKLKCKNEIRIAAMFRALPPEFLAMIVAHELAHLKEKDHNKAFYQLCCHMEPDYHQLEFDLRVWLTWQEHANG